MRPISPILSQLSGSPENGLSPEAVHQSRQLFGSNRLTPLPREPLWKKFLGKFDEPIIKILLAAALLSMFVDLFQANVSPWLPGSALGIVGILVAVTLVFHHGEWVPALLFGSAFILFFAGVS